MDSDLVETIIMIVVFVVIPLVQKIFKKEEPAPPSYEELEELEAFPDELEEPAPAPYPTAGAPAPYPSAPSPMASWDAARSRLIERLQTVVVRAEQLAEGARVQRATNRFVPTLDEWVIPHARGAIAELERSNAAPSPMASAVVESLEMVSAQVESFVEQRRNPVLRATLGDADAFAMSCYEPVADFARANGLALTSNVPVTEIGYDLAIWTAFIPTGLAPIWIPHDFFERIAWWPALAHEIAHDFYRATGGLDGGLRAQLGMVPHEVGTRPLAFGADGLSVHELYRVFGGWFEELFCDVFGTLMCGPAYGWTAAHHFAQPYQPGEIARVHIDRSGRRYDEHPPRHLRMIAIAQVLEDIGQYDDAAALRDEWASLHGGDPDAIVFPVGGQLLGLPLEPFAAITADIAHRLYSEQLSALAGYRLADIPGVDFGPHANQEAERVRGELLSGRVPHRTSARSVVAGAVLAWRDAPDRERAIIQLARRAIAAEGTFEQVEDAYASDAYKRPHPDAYAMDVAGPVTGEAAPSSSREAFLLHTVLSPPQALRRARIGIGARGGFLARRGR